MNCVQDKNHKATENEAKSCVDLNGNGKVDSALVCILESDPVFDKTSLPLRRPLHGIISSLNLNNFTM